MKAPIGGNVDVAHNRRSKSTMEPHAQTCERIRRIVADGRVTLEELDALVEFFNESREARNSWPGTAIFEVLKDILADGRVEPFELEGLERILDGLDVLARGAERARDPKSQLILIAEDSETDRELIGRALRRANNRLDLRFVVNGEELLDFLVGEGAFAGASCPPTPDLILLDLVMPKMDGMEALRRFSEIPEVGNIPVVVLTSSKKDRDIIESFRLGIHSFIEKPVGSAAWREFANRLSEFWIVS